MIVFSGVLIFVDRFGMAVELDADRHALKIVTKTAMLLGLEAMKISNKEMAAYYEMKSEALKGKYWPWFRLKPRKG